jgi:hypothetical protein
VNALDRKCHKSRNDNRITEKSGTFISLRACLEYDINQNSNKSHDLPTDGETTGKLYAEHVFHKCFLRDFVYFSGHDVHLLLIKSIVNKNL